MYQVNQLCKSTVTMDVVLNLKELLYLPHSKKMFTRLELLFVSYFSRNQWKAITSPPIFHFEKVWKELLHVTLYQRHLIYLERRYSLQDQSLMIHKFYVCYIFSWSHTQGQIENGVQLGFPTIQIRYPKCQFFYFYFYFFGGEEHFGPKSPIGSKIIDVKDFQKQLYESIANLIRSKKY